MTECLLITHQFIKKDESWKYKVFDFCMNYYKKQNPNAYIILTGHGIKPLKTTLDCCDWFYWSDEIIENDINRGHPKLVTIGLEHAKKKGFTYICKTRLDSIIMIPNIVDYCHRKLIESKKIMINTHYYKNNYLLMDLFMYSKTDDMLKMFNPNKWVVNWDKSGMGPVANNLFEDILNKKLLFPFNLEFWEKHLNDNILFLSPEHVKWVDFRTHKNIINNIRIEECNKYLWKH
uniref:Glycosyltransferase n=1 Tax=viral metagenome TaxID=1070528 RepID=A0A6C0EFQ1_9ZZZZ